MDTNMATVDNLIVGCNDAVSILMHGQYIQFCQHMVNMVQTLAALKNGIANQGKKAEEMEKRIAELEKELDGLKGAGTDAENS